MDLILYLRQARTRKRTFRNISRKQLGVFLKYIEKYERWEVRFKEKVVSTGMLNKNGNVFYGRISHRWGSRGDFPTLCSFLEIFLNVSFLVRACLKSRIKNFQILLRQRLPMSAAGATKTVFVSESINLSKPKGEGSVC